MLTCKAAHSCILLINGMTMHTAFGFGTKLPRRHARWNSCYKLQLGNATFCAWATSTCKQFVSNALQRSNSGRKAHRVGNVLPIERL